MNKGKTMVPTEGVEPSTHRIVKLLESLDFTENPSVMVKRKIWRRLKAALKTESKCKKTVTNRPK